VEIKAHRIQFLNKRALPGAEETRAEATEEPEYTATFADTQTSMGRPEESQPTPPPTVKEEEPLGDTEFDFGYKGLKL